MGGEGRYREGRGDGMERGGEGRGREGQDREGTEKGGEGRGRDPTPSCPLIHISGYAPEYYI